MTTHNALKLLLVDDDVQQVEFYAAMLREKQFDVSVTHSIAGLRRELDKSVSYHAILLDLQLGSEDGLDGLEIILSNSPSIKVFILSAHGSIDRAVEAMRKGASGFFEKGCGADHLATEITKALSLDSFEVGSSRINLEKMGLIGNSEQLRLVVEKIERLANVDSTVLILGESGTGKEVLARTIHRTSRRAKHRFSAINCGAIPESLLESELFGHKRGAFTDAKSDRKGIFEMSSSGTLLLDEIGDMPVTLQTKLLRVLQEREITPVGSSESIKIDTRIIAATHRDIRREAEEKRFREDLYYRLSIIVINIPSLRQRVEDIPLLMNHFLAIFNERFSKNVQMPSHNDMKRIMSYNWPGNIRELQNAIERSVVLAIGDRMDLDDIFAAVPPGYQQVSNLRTTPTFDVSNSVRLTQAAEPDKASEPPTTSVTQEVELFQMPLTEAKSAFEKHYLEFHVKEYQGNIHALAEKSGRYRADIYRLLNRHGIDHSNYKV